MKKGLTVSVLMLLVLAENSAGSPVDTVLNRAERYLRDITPLEDVSALISSLSKEGQWPDINYLHQERSGWEPTTHMQRLRSMALTWSDRTSPFYHRSDLQNAIGRALSHWIDKRYQSPNWWHNEIGIPRLMQDILVLLRDDLAAKQLAGAMEVLAQHRVKGTGANLTWSADLGLHYGALSGNVETIKKCSQLIESEIRITTEEGIQPDYSYHQHGARLQTYHYGGAFLTENLKLAWELRGTPWQISKEKTDILLRFILEGWQWMARGIYTVPGTVDRAVSRKDVLKNADIRKLLPYVLELGSHQTGFKEIVERQNGNGRQLTGFKHFPYSDFSAYHHPEFSFFVKTVSDRTRFSESINSENLKGRLLNSGDTYFLRDGHEYFNLMPVWEWEYLPGITSFPRAVSKQQNFVGGVSSGASGLTVMHHRAEKGEESLTVKKIWASHGKFVVCLMADLKVVNADTAYTVFDQSRWRGNVMTGTSGEISAEGVYRLENANWIHHAGFAYIPLSPQLIELHLKTATGSWSSINQSGSDEMITERIFLPLIRHDAGVSSSGYVVASCATAEDGEVLVKNPEWFVLRNDGECQSVLFKDGTLMAAFAVAGSLQVRGKQLSTDRPCLILLSGDTLYVSDPTHKGGVANIIFGTGRYATKLPEDGTTVMISL